MPDIKYAFMHILHYYFVIKRVIIIYKLGLIIIYKLRPIILYNVAS